MVPDSGHCGVKSGMEKPLPEAWDTRPAWADIGRCTARGENNVREVYQLASRDDSTDQIFPLWSWPPRSTNTAKKY